MPTQLQIDQFTLAFHQQALARMRAAPHLVQRAVDTVDRWQKTRGPTQSDPYFAKWRELLARGLDEVEGVVCAQTDSAATLRNVSPLGFVLTAHERQSLRRKQAH